MKLVDSGIAPWLPRPQVSAPTFTAEGPMGKWIAAYTSNKSGRSESASSRIQTWGDVADLVNEIFYLARDGTLMVVDVKKRRRRSSRLSRAVTVVVSWPALLQP